MKPRLFVSHPWAANTHHFALRLVQALRDCATAHYIPQSELLEGNIQQYAAVLLNQPAHWPPVRLDGAKIAAEKILALLDASA